VVTVAATVGRLNVGEGGVVTIFVDVHAITDSRAELNRVSKDASHGARSDIDHVVNGTAPLGKASEVSRQETETFLASHRSRWNASVQPQSVRDRAGVLRTAAWADWSRVLYQRKQVDTRRRRNWNAEDGTKQVRQQRVEEEIGKL
jgi:hypothetical protein